MRRILIVPSISTSSVVDSSSYQELYYLTEEVAKVHNDVFFYMVVPPWVRDGLRGHERLHYVHIETTRDIELNDIIGYSAYDLATWFARKGGKYIVDAVVTDCVQFSLQLSQFLSDNSCEPIPVFLRDIRRRDKHRNQKMETQLSIAMNLATARVGVMSDQHRSELSEYVRKHVTFSQTKRFIDKTINWPLHVNVDFLDNCKNTVDKNPKITFFVGGDPDENGGKRALVIGRKLFALGADVVFASRASASRTKLLLPDRDISYIAEIKSALPFDAYYLEVAKSHLFVSMGKTEMALNEELERLLLGQVGVFPFKKNVIDLIGDDYPFFYNEGNMDEAYEMSGWIFENYSDAIKSIELNIIRIKDKISRKKVMLDVWDNICQVIDNNYRIHKMREAEDGKSVPLFNAVQRVAKGLGEEFAMMVFLDVLEETVSYLKPWGKKGTLQTLGRVKSPLPTMYDLREMLDNLGWVDQHSGADIVVKRVKDPAKGVFRG